MDQVPQMSLRNDPIELVQKIFERLAGTYCAEWFRYLGATPIADVKTVWAHDLEGFLRDRKSMMAIAWALDNLPEKCPNSVVFRNLCRQAPMAEEPRIEAPRADPARVRAVLDKLAPLRQATGPAVTPPSKDWARKIIARKSAGDGSVTPGALAMARDALGVWGHDGYGAGV